MERVSLSAEARTATGKNAVKKIRQQGLVPAILYGRARTSLPLAVGRKDLLGALATGGRNVLIDLKIRHDGQDESNTVMVREIQRDHLRREIIHVDLHQISLTEALETRVPVTLEGMPEGVASGGGILEPHLREVLIRCLPTQIPDHLTANVSHLGVGDSLHVRDLVVPAGIEILTPPEEVLVSVVAPKEEVEEAAPAAAEAPAEPEVVGRAAAAAPAEGEGKAEGTARPEPKASKPEAKPSSGDKPARADKKE
jgi:large subunit ribosomal protein L25